MSTDERMLFISGFQQLRRNGVLSMFVETHHIGGNLFREVHKTTEFLFWHSYFVWELENQFRNLGGEYTCFSMPYWDITNDAKYLLADDSDPTSIPILNSMLGGDGNKLHDRCVEDKYWNVDEYWTEFLCADDEVAPRCCLKREVDVTMNELPTVEEFTKTIQISKFTDYENTINGYHLRAHFLLGFLSTTTCDDFVCELCTQSLSVNYSPHEQPSLRRAICTHTMPPRTRCLC